MADNVEQVVYTYLTTDSTFMANFTGVYYMTTPKAAVEPYINFWLVDDTGFDNILNKDEQGQARIQFDLWDKATDSGRIRGTRLREVLSKKIRALSQSLSGYHVTVTGSTKQTIPRASETDPYHFVVDGIIEWYKE